jgi:2-dehydro-3-deoxygalactonokinase
MVNPVNDTVATADANLQQAALIALDWGTTSLRAYLYDAAGKVLATRASTAGIMNLPRSAEHGGFDAAFDDACGAWLEQTPAMPVIAAGMVGSAQGWVVRRDAAHRARRPAAWRIAERDARRGNPDFRRTR